VQEIALILPTVSGLLPGFAWRVNRPGCRASLLTSVRCKAWASTAPLSARPRRTNRPGRRRRESARASNRWGSCPPSSAHGK